MRIAVTYENGEVFQHFGHCSCFKLYDIEDKKIVDECLLEAGEAGHGALATLLQDNEVDVLLCGGIGMGARVALNDAGIKLYPGVTGKADEAADSFIKGSLSYDSDAHCDHHENHNGDCAHEHCEKHHCAGK